MKRRIQTNPRMIYFIYAPANPEHLNVYENIDLHCRACPEVYFASTSPPHSHHRVAYCSVECSLNLFHAACHGWNIRYWSGFCSSHHRSTKGSFGDRFHRWNRRNGIRDRADRRSPHSMAQEVLDGDTLSTKALRRTQSSQGFRFIPSGLLLRSVHRAGDVNRTGRPPTFQDPPHPGSDSPAS